MQYRHGDLLITRVDALPEGAKRTKTKILAEGEATGHAHRLEGHGTLYISNGQLTLRATKEAAVIHGVEVQCPSTGKLNYLRVPPTMTRCSQAIAWTFGFEAPDLYRPLVEA